MQKDLTAEEKKAAFVKIAAERLKNFDTHKELLEKHVQPLQKHLGKESIKYFYDTGVVNGGFMLALMEYAEAYASQERNKGREEGFNAARETQASNETPFGSGPAYSNLEDYRKQFVIDLG